MEADLSRAVFDGARLNRANLFQAKAKDPVFAEEDMRDTNLGYAELDSAYLAGANLSVAYLVHATLTDADVRGEETLGADANLTGIQYDETTKWPGDYHPPASSQIDFEKRWAMPAECLRGTGP